jgi:hypothetical protein
MAKNATRIDLLLVEASQEALTKMQAQLNQWGTKGELIKFDMTVVGDKILFRILRKKGAE